MPCTTAPGDTTGYAACRERPSFGEGSVVVTREGMEQPLVWVSDAMPGIVRLRQGRGLRKPYLHPAVLARDSAHSAHAPAARASG